MCFSYLGDKIRNYCGVAGSLRKAQSAPMVPPILSGSLWIKMFESITHSLHIADVSTCCLQSNHLLLVSALQSHRLHLMFETISIFRQPAARSSIMVTPLLTLALTTTPSTAL